MRVSVYTCLFAILMAVLVLTACSRGGDNATEMPAPEDVSSDLDRRSQRAPDMDIEPQRRRTLSIPAQIQPRAGTLHVVRGRPAEAGRTLLPNLDHSSNAASPGVVELADDEFLAVRLHELATYEDCKLWIQVKGIEGLVIPSGAQVDEQSIRLFLAFDSVRYVEMGETPRLVGSDLQVFSEFKRLTHLDLVRRRTTDDELLALSGLSHLLSLALNSSRITSGYPALLAMTDLESLILYHCESRHKWSGVVSKLLKLKHLAFWSCPITDLDLSRIASLPELKSLYLDVVGLTEAGWKTLGSCHSLTTLKMFVGVHFDDDRISVGINSLTKLRLTHVELGWWGWVSHDALRSLSMITTLEEVCLEASTIDWTGIAWLATLPSLRVLDLRNCEGVTVRSLSLFVAVVQPLTIRVSRSLEGIDREEIAELMAANPNLLISSE